MGMGSVVNKAAGNVQQGNRPQPMGGKGGMSGAMPRPMDSASVSSPQPGVLNPMADTFNRPTAQPPQPIGGKGGMAGAMPPGLQPGAIPPGMMPPQMPSEMQPVISRPGMPPGYDQRFFDKQMQLRDQIQRFTDKRFGGMTPENMAQIQEAVQDRFGRKMDRLDQMRPQMGGKGGGYGRPNVYTGGALPQQMPIQAPAAGLAALSQDPTLRNLLG